MAFGIKNPSRHLRCGLLFSSVFIVSMGILTHTSSALAAGREQLRSEVKQVMC